MAAVAPPFSAWYIEGLRADRPTPGPTTLNQDCKLYYATDTGILYAWNGYAWRQIGSSATAENPVLRLDFTQSTDIASTALGTATWTDILANQPFTLLSGASVVQISVWGCVPVDDGNCAARVVVDSGGTPILIPLGGTGDMSLVSVTGAASANILAGAGVVTLLGLAAGGHTIKLQGYAVGGANVTCLAATNPDTEFLRIQVLEIP